MGYRTLTFVTKDEEKKRITDWLEESEIEWLERRKNNIEDGKKQCEIVQWNRHPNEKVFALLYKNGYYKPVNKNMDTVFVFFDN